MVVWANHFRLMPVRALLFIAFAIQGITPDPQDVVSLRGLYVVCGMPLPLEVFCDNPGEQEAAVCSPIGQQGIFDLGIIIDRASPAGLASLSPRRSQSHANASQPDALERRAVLHEQLSITLCRLAC
jgi:hypothetical protein